MESMVTVLIPFYNPGKYISRAIESVYEQTYPNWSIVLVDDGSTDNSVDLIQNYLQDPRIKLIRHSYNKGQSKSQNTALENIDTPFFIQLDADDWFYPNTLEILMKEAAIQPEDVALLSGNINIIFENIDGKFYRSVVKKGRLFTDRYDFMLANCSVWPRCYRTSILKKIGGWPTDDPYEGRHAEDLRILFRLIEDYKFHWIDEVLMYHCRHQNNQTNNINAYADTLQWIITDTLKRWGDKFKPLFIEKPDGWVTLGGLEKNE